MKIIFIKSNFEHFDEIIGERANLDFDTNTGEIFLHTLKSSKHIKFNSDVNTLTIDEYIIFKDENNLFILEDMDYLN